MFSLKSSVLSLFGLSANDNETDVEAFERIQEKFSADQAANAQAIVDAEKNFSDQVSAFEQRFAAIEENIQSMKTAVEATNVALSSQSEALNTTKVDFAKRIAAVSAGADPKNDGTETDPTPPSNADDEGGVKVSAWTKPIVKIKQHV